MAQVLRDTLGYCSAWQVKTGRDLTTKAEAGSSGMDPGDHFLAAEEYY